MTGNTSSAGSADRSDQQLIRNELLTYAFQYVHKSSLDELVKTICDFYTPDEISTARNCLWDTFENHDEVVLQGSRPRNAAKLEGTALIRCAEDLIAKGVLIVASAPQVQSPFCAIDLERIPKYAPEEVNFASIMARLIKLENNVQANKRQVESNTSALSSLKHCNRPDTIKKTPYVPHVPYVPDDPTPQQTRPSLPRNDTNRPDTMVKSFAMAAANGTSNDQSQSTTRTYVKPGWEQQRQERRRILREHYNKTKTITGSRATDAGITLKKAVDQQHPGLASFFGVEIIIFFTRASGKYYKNITTY